MTASARLIGLQAAVLIAGLGGTAIAGEPAPAPAADPDRILGIDPTPDDCAETVRANQALGGLVGGVVGGLIGSGIGKGSGKTVATISGAVLGVLGGAALGNQVAEAGETCLPEPGAGSGWINPDAAAPGEPIRLVAR